MPSRTTLLGSLALVLCVGCDEPPTLFVDLQTDLVPGVEFAVARTELSRRAFAGDAGVTETRSLERAVSTTEPYREGVRVAEFRDLETGTTFVRVRLLASDGSLVLGRTVSVPVTTTGVLSVLLTRSCRGVMCPMAGDDPSFTECLGGRCVPACEPGAPGCRGDECVEASDCPAPTDGCSVVACEEGSCFSREDAAACQALEACVAGVGCVVTCTPAPEACNGLDDDCDGSFDEGFDTSVDPEHCGGCGQRCSEAGGTAGCVDGACTITCDAGAGDCNADGSDGCETPLSTARDCGACDMACGGGTPVCAPDGSSFACASGCPDTAPTLCSGSCVNPLTSTLHCGACDAGCGAAEICQAGECACGATRGGIGAGRACGGAADTCCGDGCANIDTDVNHCGGCGIACGADEACVAGRCTCAAQSGSIGAGPACGGATATCCPTVGCVDLNTRRDHCGACGVMCGLMEGCVGGLCRCGGKAGGMAGGPICVGATPDCCPGPGCVDTGDDVTHCGGCGVACGPSEVCAGGACRCASSTGPVGGGPVCVGTSSCCPAQGCRNTDTDTANCGGCGVSCGLSETCSGAQCRCGGQTGGGGVGAGARCAGATSCCPGSGCVNTNVDANNCGACGATCGPSETCSGGRCSCGLSSGAVGGGPVCAGPMTCCVASGCRNLNADASNCGGCGVLCGPSELCSGGQCTCGSDMGGVGAGPVCSFATEQCCPGDRCRSNAMACP